jgi:hypothetical protein
VQTLQTNPQYDSELDYDLAAGVFETRRNGRTRPLSTDLRSVAGPFAKAKSAIGYASSCFRNTAQSPATKSAYLEYESTKLRY